MNIVEIMQTTSMNGLTLSEMRAKVRMKVALKAFGKRNNKEVFEETIIEVDKTPNINKDFYNLYT